MSANPLLRFKHTPVRTYPNTAQKSYVGAGNSSVLVVPADATSLNTKYVAKNGSNSNAGTTGAPYLDPVFAHSQLTGAFKYVVIQDDGVYETKQLDWTRVVAGQRTGLYAAAGKSPTICFSRGVGVIGVYGAYSAHPAYSNPPAGSYFAYVNQTNGVDGTGVLGNAALPFKTIQAAGVAARSLTLTNSVKITDSATYTEDIDGGAFPLRIQAALGCNPTLVNSLTGLTDYHIKNSGTNTIALYGLNLREKVASLGHAVHCSSLVTMDDCTVTNGTRGVYAASAAVTDSYFYNCVGAIEIYTTGTSSIQNCLFTQKVGRDGIAVSLYGGAAATVDFCTFKDWCRDSSSAFPGVAIAHRWQNGSNGDVTVTNCVFDGFWYGFREDSPAAFPSLLGTTTITNCSFKNGVRAVTMMTSGSQAGTLSELLFENNEDTDIFVQFIIAMTLTVSSICSIGNKSTAGAFVADKTSQFGTSVVAINVRNSTFLNANGYAFLTVNSGTYLSSTTTITATGCIEKGCKAIAMGSKAAPVTLVYCVFETAEPSTWPVTPSSGVLVGYTSCIKMDAKLLSTVSGQENCGLDPASVAFLSGTQYIGDDRGISAYVIRISVDNVDIRGINFVAAGSSNLYPQGLNMRGCLLIQPTVANVVVSYCTFRRFGLYGAKLLGTNCYVQNCEFRDSSPSGSLNGNGLVLSGSKCVCGGCTFISCTGAGVAVMMPGQIVQSCSSYQCRYGLFEGAGVSGLYVGNIFSQSGAFDYSGAGTMQLSCIGTTDGNVTLTSCSRLDPLYRDPDNGDLRLQTIACVSGGISYPYDSPAKFLVNTSQDAGAFLFLYKPVLESWTQFTLVYNPDNIEYEEVPIKISEGQTVSGATYSTAEAVKLRRLLTWGENNPMPAAQLENLRALFKSATSECQVSFDNGSVYVPVRVEKSTGFDYQDIDKYYNQSGKPQPLRSLSLIESA